MGSNLFSAAISSLNAAQVAIATTEHNIANANTPGFTRQIVQLSANPPQLLGGSFLGQGVDVVGVTRIYDQYLSTQVLHEQAQASYLGSYFDLMKQIDSLVADPSVGASQAMQDFFGSMNGVANSPESIPARQVLLGGAQSAVNRFQAIDQHLTDLTNVVNSKISGSVSLINTYAQQIATLNSNIKRATAAGQGQQPNDLLDQRDQIINLLNKEVKVSAIAQPDGTVSVFIGNGQAMVVDDKAMSLRVTQSPSDPSKFEVAYQNNNKIIPLQSSSLQGGNLGAYFAFRDQSLEPARNELGRVAIGLAVSVNQQNRLGLDLNGALGGDIFKVASPRVIQGAFNTGNAAVTAAITDVGALTSSDYQLKFDGTSYSMVRLLDNAVTNLGTTLTPPPTVDGFTVNLTSGAMAAGDTFLIRPTVNGARDIGVAISDPTKIAAALPMRATAALANAGTGTISSGTMNLDPVSITFDNPPTTYTVSDTSTTPPVVLSAGVIYATGSNIGYNGWTVQLTGAAPVAGDTFNLVKSANAATMRVMAASTNAGNVSISGGALDLQQPFSITFDSPTTFTVAGAVPAVVGSVAYTPGADISYNGWTVQISGTPATNDTFTVSQNTNALGDNRNALLLAGLQAKNLLANGTTSLQGAYGQFVGEVGSKTNELDVTSQAQSNMADQMVASQQAISGVNLDEEAANLLRYQNAYQAAAKAMQIASTLFDTLLAIGN